MKTALKDESEEPYLCFLPRPAPLPAAAVAALARPLPDEAAPLPARVVDIQPSA